MHSTIYSGITPPAWAFPSEDPPGESSAPGSLPPQIPSVTLRDKRVVIVEDEGLTQLQLKKACLLARMQVVGMAVDGEQGVQQVLATRPDIVLMDIKMPVLDGISAAERILQEFPVCIVMLTAYDLTEYKERAWSLGTCGYIVKPVTATTLIPQLESAYKAYHQKAQ